VFCVRNALHIGRRLCWNFLQAQVSEADHLYTIFTLTAPSAEAIALLCPAHVNRPSGLHHPACSEDQS
jgi:hypothetical protein